MARTTQLGRYQGPYPGRVFYDFFLTKILKKIGDKLSAAAGFNLFFGKNFLAYFLKIERGKRAKLELS